MKYLKNKYAALFFAGIMTIGLGFSGCEVDEEDPVTPKTLDEYRSELVEILDMELEKVQNTDLGYNKDDFRSATYFEQYSHDYDSLLTIAREIMDEPELTIADVMAANYMISSPGKAFNDEIFQSDRRELHESIIYGDTLRVHTPIGTDLGMAPQEAHDQFSAALGTAKGWRTLMSAIERQIDEAVEEIDVEIKIFEDAIIE